MRKKPHGELGTEEEKIDLRLTKNSGNTKGQQFPPGQEGNIKN